jgi:Flp pilus assembly protein TadD
MRELRMTNMALLGALRRFGRPRVDLVAGLVMLGSLAVAAGGVVALALDGPPWRGRYSVAHAARLIDDGDYASAIRTLLGAVAAAPRDARAHYYLGLAYARLGVPTGALSQLTDAVRLAPGDPLVHDALGQTFRELGDSSAARREFEAAARLDPGDARAQVDLAGLLLDQGQPTAAVEQLRRAVRLRPRSAEIRLLLATALRRAGDLNGMVREYIEVRRLAAGRPLGEIARQALNERRVR